jgi:hypothetical protein
MSSRTLTYRGPARGASALAQMLREEGVEVSYTPPVERRDITQVAEVLIIYVGMKATDKFTDAALDAAVKRATTRWRQRFGGRGATIEGDE